MLLSAYSQDRLKLYGLHSEKSSESDISIYDDVVQDYKNFYSKKTFNNSFIWLAIGSILANTKADHKFSHWYANNIRSEKLDRWSGEFRHYGNGQETLPILFGSALIGYGLEHYGIDGNGYIYDWSSKSLRSMIVGAPVLLLSQRALGAGRHTDDDDSYWKPFNDTNGVSGHAFMGAIPFITAAQMVDDKALKTALYFGSTLCAWSRLNDDDHYLSQVIMGWGLAYVSTLAVFDRESPIILAPFVDDGRFGITFTVKF